MSAPAGDPAWAPAGIPLPPGWRLLAFDVLGSTNDEAKRIAAEGAAHGTLVAARRQEAGRGRRGRGWSAPEGNLYVSAVLRPRRPGAALAQLSFAVALAAAEALPRFLPPGVEVAVKWPNDVLIDGAKAVGILLETEGTDWVVAGVGINCLLHPEDTPYAATSLAAKGAASPSPTLVLGAFAERLAHWTERWEADGFAAVRQAWLGLARGVGGPVTVRLANETLEGVFAGLDADGVLLLDLPDGSRRGISAGDVHFGTAVPAPARSGSTKGG
jgi:BirA family biotin operon repressor/biotin-[acetyl-CoA-carboxylase] ligase